MQTKFQIGDVIRDTIEYVPELYKNYIIVDIEQIKIGNFAEITNYILWQIKTNKFSKGLQSIIEEDERFCKINEDVATAKKLYSLLPL